jgi:hypothetical protein
MTVGRGFAGTGVLVAFVAAGAIFACAPAAVAQPDPGQCAPPPAPSSDQQQCQQQQQPGMPNVPDPRQNPGNGSPSPAPQQPQPQQAPTPAPQQGDLADKNCWVVNGVPRWNAPGTAPAPVGPFDKVEWCPTVYGLAPH